MRFTINITNKIAVPVNAPEIICGNSDYVIDFSFDAEWNNYAIKTARFTYKLNGKNVYKETVFTGTECKMPVMSGIDEVYVGVYAGDLTTTTPAKLTCKKSILCSSSIHKEPTDDIYTQLISLLEDNFPVSAAIKANEAAEEAKEQNKNTQQMIGSLAMNCIQKFQSHDRAINALCGNLKIVFDSYKGDGNWGESNPTVLEFENKVHFVCIFTDDLKVFFTRDYASVQYVGGSLTVDNISWTDNSLSFYATAKDGTGVAPSRQLNESDKVYHYFAFVEQEIPEDDSSAEEEFKEQILDSVKAYADDVSNEALENAKDYADEKAEQVKNDKTFNVFYITGSKTTNVTSVTFNETGKEYEFADLYSRNQINSVNNTIGGINTRINGFSVTLGNIETALDSIIEMQNGLINGEEGGDYV